MTTRGLAPNASHQPRQMLCKIAVLLLLAPGLCHAAWTDITDQLQVQAGRGVYDRISREYKAEVRVTNAGPAIDGPVLLAVTASNMAVLDADGEAAAASPYAGAPTISIAGGGMAANQAVTEVLRFERIRGRLNYSVRVLNDPSLAATRFRHGHVWLPDAEVAGLVVDARALDGGLLATTTTSRFGSFTLHFADAPPPNAYRVDAFLPDGTVLSREVRGEASWHWVNGLTTLVSRYMLLNPDASPEEARDLVRARFGIPADTDLGSGLGDTWRSPFVWSEFVAAAGDTPLDAYFDQHATALETGEALLFRKQNPFAAVHRLLGRDFYAYPAEPSTGALSTFGGPAGATSTMTASEDGGSNNGEGELLGATGFTDSYTGSIFSGIFGNLATAAFSDVVGAIFEACGVNFGKAGEAEELETIENDVSQILTDITDIQTELQNAQQAATIDLDTGAAQTAAQALEPIINRINTLYSDYYQPGVQSIQQTLSDGADIGVPFNGPPGQATQAVEQLDAYYNGSFDGGQMLADFNLLRDYLFGRNGNPSLPLLYNQTAAAYFGSQNPGTDFMLVDVRNNEINENLSNKLDYYRAYLLLLYNLISEYSFAENASYPQTDGTPVVNPLPGRLAELMQTMRETSRDLAASVNLSPPPTIASDDVFVIQNTMWAEAMHYSFAPPAPYSWFSGTAAQFSFGPWGAGLWRLPFESEAETLCTYLNNVAPGEPIAAAVGLGLMDSWWVDDFTPAESEFFIPINTTNGGYFDANADLYDMTDCQVGIGDATNNYLLTANKILFVRSTPGWSSPDNFAPDAGTLAAVAYPTSLDQPVGLSQQVVTGYMFQVYNPPGDPFGPTELVAPGGFPTLHAWSSSDADALELLNFDASERNPDYLFGSPIFHTANPASGSVSAEVYVSAEVDALGNPSAVALSSDPLDFSTLATEVSQQPAAPELLNLFITPQNQVYDGAGVSVGPHTEESFPYFVTGVYSDGTYTDMTAAVNWTVDTQGATGSGSASFDIAAGQAVLKVPAAVGNATLVIEVADPQSGLQSSTQALTAY